MRAMILRSLAPLSENAEPLELVQLPNPSPGVDEVLIEISVCGVCHTELDEIEGRVRPTILPIVPGHEVVGRVAACGQNCQAFSVGDRVGVGWIYSSDREEGENLSAAFAATGRDAHGGYAEFMVIGERYVYPIPPVFSDVEAAPLLCAGGVGYRSLCLTGLEDGQVLGLTGFGASGHLVLQLAKHIFPRSPVYVFARSEREQEFARSLGADWCGHTEDRPPSGLHAVIDTTPAWTPVLAALTSLLPGGRLVINAIRKEASDQDVLARLDYAEHLWLEKEIKTVANVTREDIAEFLAIAAEIPIRVETQTYALENANRALLDLRSGNIRGAKVLLINNNL